MYQHIRPRNIPDIVEKHGSYTAAVKLSNHPYVSVQPNDAGKPNLTGYSEVTGYVHPQ